MMKDDEDFKKQNFDNQVDALETEVISVSPCFSGRFMHKMERFSRAADFVVTMKSNGSEVDERQLEELTESYTGVLKEATRELGLLSGPQHVAAPDSMSRMADQ